jgi:hypothetical protein
MTIISTSTNLRPLPKWTEMNTVTLLCWIIYPKWKLTSMRWTRTSSINKISPRSHSHFSGTESLKSRILTWFRTFTQRAMPKVGSPSHLSNKAQLRTYSTKVGNRMTSLILTSILGRKSIITTTSCQWRKWVLFLMLSSPWWWPGLSVILHLIRTNRNTW